METRVLTPEGPAMTTASQFDGPAPLRVLIPTHGRPDLLIRTLASLAGCELPANYGETVVAENGSDAGARDACAEADPRLNVRYVQFAEGNKSGRVERRPRRRAGRGRWCSSTTTCASPRTP